MKAEKNYKNTISRTIQSERKNARSDLVKNQSHTFNFTSDKNFIQRQNNTIQRQIIVTGTTQKYLDDVKRNLGILLSDNWTGIKLEESPNNLKLSNDESLSPQTFIDLAGNNASARLLRRRIAAIEQNPFGDDCSKEITIAESSESSECICNNVSWNSEEKMICFTENGFQLCPPEILLIHEIGHSDGFFTESSSDYYDNRTYTVENKVFKAPKEELRNVGLGTLNHPLSENTVREQKGLSQRVLYNKLLNWWIKDNKLTMELCGDSKVLDYYREKFKPQHIISLIYETSPEIRDLKIENYLELLLVLKPSGTQLEMTVVSNTNQNVQIRPENQIDNTRNIKPRSYTNNDITFK